MYFIWNYELVIEVTIMWIPDIDNLLKVDGKRGRSGSSPISSCASLWLLIKYSILLYVDCFQIALVVIVRRRWCSYLKCFKNVTIFKKNVIILKVLFCLINVYKEKNFKKVHPKHIIQVFTETNDFKIFAINFTY